MAQQPTTGSDTTKKPQKKSTKGVAQKIHRGTGKYKTYRDQSRRERHKLKHWIKHVLDPANRNDFDAVLKLARWVDELQAHPILKYIITNAQNNLITNLKLDLADRAEEKLVNVAQHLLAIDIVTSHPVEFIARARAILYGHLLPEPNNEMIMTKHPTLKHALVRGIYDAKEAIRIRDAAIQASLRAAEVEESLSDSKETAA